MELHFRTGVRPVAELVFETLQPHRVALPVGQKARQEEAGEPPAGLGQHQMGVALRHREKPFVPHQAVRFAGSAAIQRLSARRIAQHVRTALLLGHPHADQQAALLAAGLKMGVVAVAEQRLKPAVERRGQRLKQQRRGGEGHGDGAKRPRLNLTVKHKPRAAGDEGADAGILLPGQIVYPIGKQALHQQMPGWMKAHVVEPLPGGVEAQQLRRIGVGKPAKLQRLRGAQLLPDTGEQLGIPLGRLAVHRFTERNV